MKQWTKDFLDKPLPNKIITPEENAQQAENGRLKIPTELWIELSDAILSSQCLFFIRHNKKSTLQQKFNSVFMAGFAIGWAEKNKKVQ